MPKDLLRNDRVEVWCRSFQSSVVAHHPNMWRFLDVLKREQSLKQLNINQLVARIGRSKAPVTLIF